MEKQSAGRFQGLEGIRAYAFLLVFLVHYTVGLNDFSLYRGQYWLYPWIFVAQFSWMAVPVFFVLSGFLITGVLYDTRDRGGFFRVFYCRRALRILPIYYGVLGLTAVAAALTHVKLDLRELSYIFYAQNLFFRHGGDYDLGRYLSLTHLWSLAVEEQFYLLWPVVIWFVRKRSWLLWVSYGVIVGACLLRVAWYLLKLPMEFAYFFTLTRCDALMIGAALALHKRQKGFRFERLLRPAQVALLVAFAIFVGKILLRGNALPWDPTGVVILMPIVNVMSAALVVLAVIPGNCFHSWFSQPWAVSLGGKTYSLYVIHFVAFPFFVRYLPAFFIPRFGDMAARSISVMTCAVLTYILASLSYRFLEMPAMRMKENFPYGRSSDGETGPAAVIVAGVQERLMNFREKLARGDVNRDTSPQRLKDSPSAEMDRIGQ